MDLKVLAQFSVPTLIEECVAFRKWLIVHTRQYFASRKSCLTAYHFENGTLQIHFKRELEDLAQFGVFESLDINRTVILCKHENPVESVGNIIDFHTGELLAQTKVCSTYFVWKEQYLFDENAFLLKLRPNDDKRSEIPFKIMWKGSLKFYMPYCFRVGENLLVRWKKWDPVMFLSWDDNTKTWSDIKVIPEEELVSEDTPYSALYIEDKIVAIKYLSAATETFKHPLRAFVYSKDGNEESMFGLPRGTMLFAWNGYLIESSPSTKNVSKATNIKFRNLKGEIIKAITLPRIERHTIWGNLLVIQVEDSIQVLQS